MFKKFLILFFLVLGLLFVTSPALALAPLVPCGGSGQPACTTCDFLVLGKNISDFILFYLVPAISAALFIYAGFEILLGGGITSRVQRGYKVFQTTAGGLAIIFLAWMIVNTTLRTVAGDQNIAQNWWKLECQETVTNTSTTFVTTSPTPTTSPSVSPSNSPSPTISPSSTATPTPSDTPTPTDSPTPTVSSSALVCRFTGENLCQGGSSTCSQDTCSNYSEAIKKAATSTMMGALNSAALIRAFMSNESSCNISAVNNSVSPPSCGLMQLQPTTANRFRSQCGITASITCDWLRNSNNAEASICIAAKYIKSIASGTCGNQVRNIAAGYNGGVGACTASNDCKNNKSCDGGVVKKWECLYDSQPSPLHCNTGYDETRAYAPKVQACYNSIR